MSRLIRWPCDGVEVDINPDSVAVIYPGSPPFDERKGWYIELHSGRCMFTMDDPRRTLGADREQAELEAVLKQFDLEQQARAEHPELFSFKLEP